MPSFGVMFWGQIGIQGPANRQKMFDVNMVALLNSMQVVQGGVPRGI